MKWVGGQWTWIATAVAVITLLVAAVWAIPAAISDIPDFRQHPIALSIIIACTYAIILANGFIGNQSARRIGPGLPFARWHSLAFAATFCNYFLPLKAGSALRVVVYAQDGRHDPVSFIASLAFSTLVVQAIAATVVVMALFASAHRELSHVITLGAAAVVPLALAVVFAGWGERRPVPALFARFRTGLAKWRDAPMSEHMVLVAAVSVVLGATAIRYLAIAELTSLEFSLGQAATISSAAAISSVIGITIGGVGIREGAAVIAGSLIGLSWENVVALTLIERAISMVFVFVTGAMPFRRALRSNAVPGG